MSSELLVLDYSDGTGENDLIVDYSDGSGENDLTLNYSTVPIETVAYGRVKIVGSDSLLTGEN